MQTEIMLYAYREWNSVPCMHVFPSQSRIFYVSVLFVSLSLSPSLLSVFLDSVLLLYYNIYISNCLYDLSFSLFIIIIIIFITLEQHIVFLLWYVLQIYMQRVVI